MVYYLLRPATAVFYGILPKWHVSLTVINGLQIPSLARFGKPSDYVGLENLATVFTIFPIAATVVRDASMIRHSGLA